LISRGANSSTRTGPDEAEKPQLRHILPEIKKNSLSQNFQQYSVQRFGVRSRLQQLPLKKATEGAKSPFSRALGAIRT